MMAFFNGPGREKSTLSDHGCFSLFLASGILKNAAEVWNVQSRSNALIYRGHRSHSTYQDFCDDDTVVTPAVLVTFRRGCIARGCDWEKCRIDGDSAADCDCLDADCETWPGVFTISGECDDRALIELAGNTTQVYGNPNHNYPSWYCGTSPVDWNVEPDRSDSEPLDVRWTLLHEFGHALGLGHSDNSLVDGNAIMNEIAPDIEARVRHLFTWDKDCVENLHVSDSRKTRYRFVENTGGTSWSPTQNPLSYTGQDTTRGSAMGGSWNDGTTPGFAGYVSDGQYYFAIWPSPHLVTPNAHMFWSPHDSYGYYDSDTLPDYLEALNTTPFLFQRFADLSDGERINYTWDSDDSDPHPPELRFANSTDQWDSSTWKRYWQCTDSSCNYTEVIESSVPLVSAYDPY